MGVGRWEGQTRLATTASATAKTSVKAGTDIVRAVDTQIHTARGVVTAHGNAVLAALSQARADLPASNTASVDHSAETTVTPSVPATSTGVSASGSVNGSTSTPASAGVAGSATGSVSALLGGK